MTRQNIFEILKERYDIVDEMNKIQHLFQDVMFRKPCEYSTIEGIFHSKFFIKWKNRGTCLSCGEMRDKLNIPNKYTKKTSEDEIIIALEYYVNILNPIVEKLPIIKAGGWTVDERFILLLENISAIIDYLNYEKKWFKEKDMVLILPKNPESIAVAEISTPETAFAILKYNHVSLKGDLVEKRNLLNSIYIEYETVLENPIDNYKDFYKKTTQLYNNLHIRHDNKTKENNKNTVINLAEKELEKWYDELYQLLLFCVLIKDNLERKKEVEGFLKSIKGAKA